MKKKCMSSPSRHGTPSSPMAVSRMSFLETYPEVYHSLQKARTVDEAHRTIRQICLHKLKKRPDAMNLYRRRVPVRQVFPVLLASDIALIRLLDYLDNAGREFSDRHVPEGVAVSDPVGLLWRSLTEKTELAGPDFFEDMQELMAQMDNNDPVPSGPRPEVQRWMERFPSGLDRCVEEARHQNRDRIIRVIISRIEDAAQADGRYSFSPKLARRDKQDLVRQWWNEFAFQYRFAARDPDTLNAYLGWSLPRKTMDTLRQARAVGIPIFVNPYYLSLLNPGEADNPIGSDAAIRDYILYSRQLVREFGKIVAWEKEDLVEPGKPNAAGWVLPSGKGDIHRRYPEVAIIIPGTRGRACGGLCSCCQRMYDFQRGRLKFELKDITPRSNWRDHLDELLDYFENDSQLRDILITGGDALMSRDENLERILESVYQMARRKARANRTRKNGEKYAQILRIRLGTRLLAYLPQRINGTLIRVLREFRQKAARAGIRQFIIQTHFESPLEVTREAVKAIHRILDAGWIVANQTVFTAASSRRGHTARLRQVLNDAGVLTYYTFSVKGYLENQQMFATCARSMQEQVEEKSLGQIPADIADQVNHIDQSPADIVDRIERLRRKRKVPFLATDRNILNLPGVGKSQTFRVIGLTPDGRRILEFEHDDSRSHSPITRKMGRISIVESKSVAAYLRQMRGLGENPADYSGIFGFSLGVTEPRMSLWDYPGYDFRVTDHITNLQID